MRRCQKRKRYVVFFLHQNCSPFLSTYKVDRAGVMIQIQITQPTQNVDTMSRQRRVAATSRRCRDVVTTLCVYWEGALCNKKVFIFFLFLRQGTSNEYPQHMFWWRNKICLPDILLLYRPMNENGTVCLSVCVCLSELLHIEPCLLHNPDLYIVLIYLKCRVC